MKSLLIKKVLPAIFVFFMLVNSASASVTLEFVSTVGGTPASLYDGVTNMNIGFGDMSLINTPGGLLDGVVVEISDVSIGSKIQDYSTAFLSSASYQIDPVVDVMGVNFYKVFLGDSTPTLIFSADLNCDTLFTIGASGTVNASIENMQLHNTGKWAGFIPQELVSLEMENIVNLVINLSASGFDITDYIDNSDPIATMTVHGTLPVADSVPEPSIVLMFSLGVLWLPLRKRKKSF